MDPIKRAPQRCSKVATHHRHEPVCIRQNKRIVLCHTHARRVRVVLGSPIEIEFAQIVTFMIHVVFQQRTRGPDKYFEACVQCSLIALALHAGSYASQPLLPTTLLFPRKQDLEALRLEHSLMPEEDLLGHSLIICALS